MAIYRTVRIETASDRAINGFLKFILWVGIAVFLLKLLWPVLLIWLLWKIFA